MQKLLIADPNEDFRLALADALRSRFHVLCCRSGTAALDLLHQETPDVLVLDLMLPAMDGMTLLENSIAEGIRPKVLVITAMLTDYVFQSASRLGIGYIMMKPCDVQTAAIRIADLANSSPASPHKSDKRALVSEALLSLNIRPKHDGYRYMIEAILLMAKDPRQSVTKELYPAVSKIFGSKGIERSIRNALDVAWKHRNPETWQKYFPDTENRPSNAVFLARMAEELRR